MQWEWVKLNSLISVTGPEQSYLAEQVYWTLISPEAAFGQDFSLGRQAEAMGEAIRDYLGRGPRTSLLGPIRRNRVAEGKEMSRPPGSRKR